MFGGKGIEVYIIVQFIFAVIKIPRDMIDVMYVIHTEHLLVQTHPAKTKHHGQHHLP